MKFLSIILICILNLSISLVAQEKLNVFDENTTMEKSVLIYERIDGSIFELNGQTDWTALKLLPDSKYFAKFIMAKKPLTVDFETINGTRYTNKNGGNWKKSIRQLAPQGSMKFNANYNKQQKIINVSFNTSNSTLIEINLYSLYGTENFVLHKRNEQIGQHRLQLPVAMVTKGEYVLVLSTPQKAESVRISITD